MVKLKALPKVYERDVEKYFVRKMTAIGGMVIKLTGARGIQDRLVALPRGRTWFVEIKKPDGKMAKLQKKRKHELRELGHNVWTVWDQEDVDHLVNRIEGTYESKKQR